MQFDWPRILKQAPEIKSSDADGAAPRGRAAERSQGDRPRSGDRASRDRSPRESDPAPRLESQVEVAAAGEADLAPEEPVALEPVEENREAAVFQRLGPEALARLRARYAEVKARITERQMEEADREELKGRAERLNPDGWVTDAEVDDGLEQYEAVYESIRAVVGHARKRRP